MDQTPARPFPYESSTTSHARAGAVEHMYCNLRASGVGGRPLSDGGPPVGRLPPGVGPLHQVCCARPQLSKGQECPRCPLRLWNRFPPLSLPGRILALF
eukprot:1108559-Prymnesium_polylepis.1